MADRFLDYILQPFGSLLIQLQPILGESESQNLFEFFREVLLKDVLWWAERSFRSQLIFSRIALHLESNFRVFAMVP